jgi:hypothetical protein
VVVAVGLGVWVHPAAAQTGEPARFTLSAGAGVSNPLHGDFDFIAPSWDVAVRGRASEHLTIEAFVAEWRHTKRSDYFDIPIQSPAGVIGRIGRISSQRPKAAAAQN